MQTVPPLQISAEELAVTTLGPCNVHSPLGLSTRLGDGIPDYVPDDVRVTLEVESSAASPIARPTLFEKAGPRHRIYFEPRRVRAGIVTCGGLCPGINNVIRSLVLELHHKYGVEGILGFRYGYQGLDPESRLEPQPLLPSDVLHVHRQGGSMLGVSRGARNVGAMVDTLVRHRLDVLFAIGGDGTLRGAHAIALEARRRSLPLAVIGIPKTIDNDIEYIDKTFGYDTAVDLARAAVDAAHTEALNAYNGVGIVKLMGRDAGFIAAAATLASREVNFCLIPEVPFHLHGERGLLAALERRLEHRRHALLVVAEGCAMQLGLDRNARDASGNARYASQDLDVGTHLRDAITKHLASRGIPATVKYIDPSYMIRSVPANAQDAIFCDALARNAVHAAMAGKTDVVIGRIHRVFTHVPLALIVNKRKRVNPDGGLWLAVTEATEQQQLWEHPPSSSGVPIATTG
ncbi:MAG: ATP-dependent 6-phosphofructokinase [Labilithrix sp.]